jgi:hypothetical protein
MCGNANAVNWSRQLDEIYSAEMLVRYQNPLPDPFVAEMFDVPDYAPGQHDWFLYFSQSSGEWNLEIAHPPSFRRVIAKQTLKKDSEGNMGAEGLWGEQSDDTKRALNCTLWREEPIHAGNPNAAPAGDAARCPPKYCLMPMSVWVERAAKLTAMERGNDRLFRLMDGYCHLMTWAYRLHDSAAATAESKLRAWYDDAGRAVQLLTSYLPVMLASVAQVDAKPNPTEDDLEHLLVTKHSDCKFSKTKDQMLPSQLIEWLMTCRTQLEGFFEAWKRGDRDRDDEEEDDDREAQDNALANSLLFWVPPPPVVRRRN